MAHQLITVLGFGFTLSGLVAYAQARSVPRFAAGVGLGGLFIGSGLLIREDAPYGLEAAFGSSAITAIFIGRQALALKRKGGKWQQPAALSAMTAYTSMYYLYKIPSLSIKL